MKLEDCLNQDKLDKLISEYKQYAKMTGVQHVSMDFEDRNGKFRVVTGTQMKDLPVVLLEGGHIEELDIKSSLYIVSYEKLKIDKLATYSAHETYIWLHGNGSSVREWHLYDIVPFGTRMLLRCVDELHWHITDTNKAYGINQCRRSLTGTKKFYIHMNERNLTWKVELDKDSEVVGSIEKEFGITSMDKISLKDGVMTVELNGDSISKDFKSVQEKVRSLIKNFIGIHYMAEIHDTFSVYPTIIWE